jgi:hypothetical protein
MVTLLDLLIYSDAKAANFIKDLWDQELSGDSRKLREFELAILRQRQQDYYS